MAFTVTNAWPIVCYSVTTVYSQLGGTLGPTAAYTARSVGKQM